MRVLVTGATGFVGTRLCDDLVKAGYQVRALVRPGSELKWDKPLRIRVNVVKGDCMSPQDLKRAMRECGAVINLVGIIREFPKKGVTFERMHIEATRLVLEAAKEAGIKRFLHMSALGTRPNALTGYHQSKWQGEQLVRESELDWTIFRPSLIAGPGPGFVSEMNNLIKFGFVPVIGDGQCRMQPVALSDLSKVMALSIETEKTHRQILDVAGPDIQTFNEVLDTIGQAHAYEDLGKIHMPVKLAMKLAGFFDQFSFFPFGKDQVMMTQEDNLSHKARHVWAMFNMKPRTLIDTLADFLGSHNRQLDFDIDQEIAHALALQEERVRVAPEQSPLFGAEETNDWRDANKGLDKRMTLAREEVSGGESDLDPMRLLLEAAMAQTDCGACGYDCNGYAEALFAADEKNTGLCAPGGDATTSVVDKLFGEYSRTPGS